MIYQQLTANQQVQYNCKDPYNVVLISPIQKLKFNSFQKKVAPTAAEKAERHQSREEPGGRATTAEEDSV